MYKFIMTQGACGSPYNLSACEIQANKMYSEGYVLSHVYQTNTAACLGQSKSVLVMVFKKAS